MDSTMRFLEDSDEPPPTGKKKAILDQQRSETTRTCMIKDFEELLLINESFVSSSQLATNTSTYVGGLCPCLNNDQIGHFYCPPEAPVCQVTIATGAISCLAESSGSLQQFMFPLSIFLFIMFGVLCFCSPKGSYSRGYTKKLIFCWSEDRYRQALEQELNTMARRIQRRRQAARRVQMRSPNRIYLPGNAPTIRYLNGGTDPVLSANDEILHEMRNIEADRRTVILKTKLYQDEKAMLEEQHIDTDLETCAICLNHFHEGERVGDIPCNHVFHVECLKEWIARKNHCPLCNGNELATKREPPRARATTSSTEVSPSSSEES